VIVYSCGHPPVTVTSVNVISADRSQLSVADAVPVLLGSVTAVQRTVILAGQVIVGATLSVIVISWLQVEKFPQSSVDFHVLVMMNFCGHEPAAVTSVKVIVREASQLSEEVGLPVLAGNELAVH